MTVRIPTPALLALALAALVANAALTSGVAIAEGETVNALGELGIVPSDAFLTGDVQDTLNIGGVSIGVQPAGDAYALTFTNDTDEGRAVHVSVRLSETSGSMMGRMLPMPQDLGEVTLKTVVPPNSTLTQRVGEGIYGETAAPVATLKPPASLSDSEEEELMFMGEFTTHGFHFLSNGPEQVPLGSLQMDATLPMAVQLEQMELLTERG